MEKAIVPQGLITGKDDLIIYRLEENINQAMLKMISVQIY